MKVFVLILAIINSNGEFEVKSSVVSECPETQLFTAIMENKRIHNEIQGWSAICRAFDVNVMMGREPT